MIGSARCVVTGAALASGAATAAAGSTTPATAAAGSTAPATAVAGSTTPVATAPGAPRPLRGALGVGGYAALGGPAATGLEAVLEMPAPRVGGLTARAAPRGYRAP